MSPRVGVLALQGDTREHLQALNAAGAEAAFAVAQPILDRFSARGLIHKNKAARHKSRITARIKALKAA